MPWHAPRHVATVPTACRGMSRTVPGKVKECTSLEAFRAHSVTTGYSVVRCSFYRVGRNSLFFSLVIPHFFLVILHVTKRACTLSSMGYILKKSWKWRMHPPREVLPLFYSTLQYAPWKKKWLQDIGIISYWYDYIIRKLPSLVNSSVEPATHVTAITGTTLPCWPSWFCAVECPCCSSPRSWEVWTTPSRFGRRSSEWSESASSVLVGEPWTNQCASKPFLFFIYIATPYYIPGTW